jgi:hypothetical protein
MLSSGVEMKLMMIKESTLSSLRLRQLLIDIKEHSQNTCVRVRLLGEMWRSYFMRVVSVSEDRVLLSAEAEGKLSSIPLTAIIQIELDHKFKEYQPHNHYTVQPNQW